MSRVNEGLRRQVFDSLNAALEGGYDMTTWEPVDITEDLLMCDADIEGEDPEEVEEYVREWLRTYNEDEEGHL